MGADAHIENFKLVAVTPPAAIVDAAAFTTAVIDTKGWAHARFVVQLGATDIAMTVLKLTECDTVGGSYTDVTGGDFDGDTDIDGDTAALPSATDDDGFFVVDVDLRGRLRFLDLSATAGDGSAGTYASILCELFRGDAMPVTMAGHGATGMLKI